MKQAQINPNFVVLAYDIRDDERRRALAAALTEKRNAIAMTESVYEFDGTGLKMTALGRELERFIDVQTDSIALWDLDGKGMPRRFLIGKIAEAPTLAVGSLRLLLPATTGGR